MALSNYLAELWGISIVVVPLVLLIKPEYLKRLFLEIETDGIITPEEAFFRAAEILVQHFSLLKETFEKKIEEPVQ